MDIFKNYVQKFDVNDEMISRKYHHSVRVKGLCKILAEELDLNDKEKRLAELCGLYHDIGRFKQAKMYHSFQDLKTTDHGDLGYKVFLRSIAPKLDLSKTDESIMAKVVMYHNKLKIPRLSEKTKVLLELVRDADKIDILYQMAYVKNTIALDDEEISEKVYNAFMKKEAIDRKLITNDSENNILKLALIFDLNHKESIKIMIENKYLEKIRKKLSNKKYDKYFDILEEYIKENYYRHKI